MKRTAFTLIEILIVVILLGILAAIVIPQFTDTSEEANAAAAASVESTLKSQSQLYKFHSAGTFPTVDQLVNNGFLDEDPDLNGFTVTRDAANETWTVTKP